MFLTFVGYDDPLGTSLGLTVPQELLVSADELIE
jgi:hypothetical protein